MKQQGSLASTLICRYPLQGLGRGLEAGQA